jgi:phosphohistidine phosphatase
MEAVVAMAAHLEADGIRPALVLCSGARRTRQTLAGVLPALGGELEIRIEPELYTFDADVLLARLRRVEERMPSAMLIGHNPAMQELALSLASGGPRRADLEVKFPTGALATIDLATDSWAEVRPENGQLVEFVAPRDLG